jgi:5-deoxy-glucuronate isomerase
MLGCLHFVARRLAASHTWSFQTDGHELALIILGGTADVVSSRGQWQGVGQRPDVFAGLPYALYPPPATESSVTAVTGCGFAAAWVRAEPGFAPPLVTPAEVGMEIRGGDHATRQTNQMLPPGFPCRRLVVVEVYTPAGSAQSLASQDDPDFAWVKNTYQARDRTYRCTK